MVAEAGLPKRHAVIGQRPDHHRRPQQPVEQEAQPERDDADDEDEHRHEHDRHGEDDEVDQEGDHAARQHALEQLGVGGRIVGVRLELDRHADAPGFAGGHDSQSRPSSPSGNGQNRRDVARGTASQLAGRRGDRVWARLAADWSLSLEPVTLADIEAARRVIAGHVLRTPMLPAPRLSALTGAEVFVKYENLQVTNSFKERGARTKLASLYGGRAGARRDRHVGRQPRPGGRLSRGEPWASPRPS